MRVLAGGACVVSAHAAARTGTNDAEGDGPQHRDIVASERNEPRLGLTWAARTDASVSIELECELASRAEEFLEPLRSNLVSPPSMANHHCPIGTWNVTLAVDRAGTHGGCTAPGMVRRLRPFNTDNLTPRQRSLRTLTSTPMVSAGGGSASAHAAARTDSTTPRVTARSLASSSHRPATDWRRPVL